MIKLMEADESLFRVMTGKAEGPITPEDLNTFEVANSDYIGTVKQLKASMRARDNWRKNRKKIETGIHRYHRGNMKKIVADVLNRLPKVASEECLESDRMELCAQVTRLETLFLEEATCFRLGEEFCKVLDEAYYVLEMLSDLKSAILKGTDLSSLKEDFEQMLLPLKDDEPDGATGSKPTGS